MDSYIGQIRICSFGFAPQDFAECNGQLLNIQQNQALYALLGTAFGGDGKTTFALPDLRGRVPVDKGQASNPLGTIYNMGNKGGLELVPLTAAQIPAHTHSVNAASTGDESTTSVVPTASTFGPVVTTGGVAPFNIYAPYNGTNMVALEPGSVLTAGGGQGHNNFQPSLALNFCICTTGIFPSRP